MSYLRTPYLLRYYSLMTFCSRYFNHDGSQWTHRPFSSLSSEVSDSGPEIMSGITQSLLYHLEATLNTNKCPTLESRPFLECLLLEIFGG
jgi:hypothetical protein